MNIFVRKEDRFQMYSNYEHFVYLEAWLQIATAAENCFRIVKAQTGTPLVISR